MTAKHCPHLRLCPSCPHFKEDYEDQLSNKRVALKHIMGKVWKSHWNVLDKVLRPVIPSPAEVFYRTSSKLALHQDADGKGNRRLGIYAPKSKNVIDIPSCAVHHPAVNSTLDLLFRSAKSSPPAPLYDHIKARFQPQRLKFVTIRYAPMTGQTGVVISHTGVDENILSSWLGKTLGPKVSCHATALTANDRGLVFGKKSTHLVGPKTMDLEVQGVRYHLSPLGFFQANGLLADGFARHVTKLQIPGGDILLDLYGGFGAYSFPLAKDFKKILLVDSGKEGIHAAREAKDRLGLDHIYASAATAEDFMKARLDDATRSLVTHVIVNPPRDGLSPKLASLLTTSYLPKLRSLTYVSCNPETLVRDLASIGQDPSFRVASITPFDMFPQTGHIETIVHGAYC